MTTRMLVGMIAAICANGCASASRSDVAGTATFSPEASGTRITRSSPSSAGASAVTKLASSCKVEV